jgi:hypothetical protein
MALMQELMDFVDVQPGEGGSTVLLRRRLRYARAGGAAVPGAAAAR